MGINKNSLWQTSTNHLRTISLVGEGVQFDSMEWNDGFNSIRDHIHATGR